MGRTTGGGTTTGGSVFTTSKTGTGSYGASLYIDLGLIPTGQRIWFGSCQYSSSKSGTFELRSSLATKSAGTDTDTKLLASISASSKTGTVTQDLYKNNALHTVSVTSTGVEKFWIKAKSTVTTNGTYYYKVNYTVE